MAKKKTTPKKEEPKKESPKKAPKLDKENVYVAMRTFDGGKKMIVKGEEVTITDKTLAGQMMAKGIIGRKNIDPKKK